MFSTPAAQASLQLAYQTPLPRVVVVDGLIFMVVDVVPSITRTVVVVGAGAVVAVVADGCVNGATVGCPVRATATATIGEPGGLAPREPKKATLPKEKIPPSSPTMR